MSTPARLELARDLHDGIAQDLVALGYQMDLLLATPGASLESRREIRTIRFSIDALISKVRREMYDLRQPEVESLQEELAHLAQEICGDHLTTVEIEFFAINPELIPHLKAIAIELLRNSKSHSRASQIELRLTSAENLTYLEVSDNGSGGAVVGVSRLGLTGVKERVELLNGKFEIISNQGGTSIKVIL